MISEIMLLKNVINFKYLGDTLGIIRDLYKRTLQYIRIL